MGENVRYLMHKYDIVNSDWSQNIDISYTRYKIQDTRYFISGTKPIVKTY